MHVVLVVDALASGGAQRQLVELAVRLHAGRDTRSTVLVYHDVPFYEPRLRESAVPLVKIPRRGRADPGFLWRLRRWLSRGQVDVVHSFLLIPCIWTLLAIRGLPRRARPAWIAAERNSLIATSRALGAMQSLVYRRADAVTVNADCVVGEIRQKLGVPAERIHYLPNGIDLARWDADTAQESPIELEPGRFHLALVGGLRPQKGHRVLFEALARLGAERVRDWRIWCIGGATAGRGAADAVEAQIQQLGLAQVVRLHPPVRNVAAVMARLDVLVLPSLYEGFPNVVLEAMASRIPVVATRTGDVPRLVTDGVTGFQVEVDDPADLAAALAKLAAMTPSERRVMGERGRARVEASYEMTEVAAAYCELYRGVLAKRP
jgi:glycosyltransferase involved in cell wall biosynthesis